MDQDNQDNHIWPPSPFSYLDKNAEDVNYPKLFTGVAGADTLLGTFLSLISFTLLTFILANPIAGHLLPSLDKFSSGWRLLTGWFLGGITQIIGWLFFRRYHYSKLGGAILWTSIPVGLGWLLLIVVAWWLLG